MGAPTAADKKRWDKLRADYLAATAARDELEIEMNSKYGRGHEPWWPRSARTKREKLRERQDKIGAKITDLLVRVSPRGETWLSGVPAYWIYEKLTWEDAIRPANEPLSVVVPGAYGYPDGYFKESRRQTMPTRKMMSRRQPSLPGLPDIPEDLEIQIPHMETWMQIGGDIDPGTYGAIIARSDGDALELVEIQPVREYLGDGEARDTGFPFWSKEARYDLEDLNPKREEVQRALAYSGLELEALEEAAPPQRALAIAEVLLQYGDKVEEGPAGWSDDVVTEPVKWWTGAIAGSEYLADEDAEFRREILGEEDDEDDEEEDDYEEPTAQDVLRVFRAHFARENKDPERASARIAELISSAAGDADRVDKALAEIDEIIDGHGVEAIRGAWVDNYYGDVVGLYVNTGDTYNNTVVYDTTEDRFDVTTMGDWVESYSDKYEIT